MSLQQQFGNIDIYLFDQLLKGRFAPAHRILDAGCGSGRNLVYFLQNDYEVYGVDRNAEAIEAVQDLAQQLNDTAPADHFVQSEITALPFANNFFDVIICNAVLHFAEDKEHFEKMLHSIWQALKKEGYLLIRLASKIGIEDKVQPLGKGRYQLPDGSSRFLVTQEMLLDYTEALGGQLFEPIKTTNVQGRRAMTTWCVQKG